MKKIKRGFTLIELLAVIIILAILMIIAVPNILTTLQTAREQAFKTQAQSVYKAAEQQFIIDSMTGSGKTCYSKNKNSLKLSSLGTGVDYRVDLSSNGTVSNIVIIDTSQKLSVNGTRQDNLQIKNGNNAITSVTDCSGSSTHEPTPDPTPTPTNHTITINVTGGSATPSSLTYTSSNVTSTISASTDYTTTGATLSCDSGITGSISGTTLTISSATKNGACTVTNVREKLRLFQNNDINSITGGWSDTYFRATSGTPSTSVGTTLRISTDKGSRLHVYLYTNNKINVNNYSKLCYNYTYSYVINDPNHFSHHAFIFLDGTNFFDTNTDTSYDYYTLGSSSFGYYEHGIIDSYGNFYNDAITTTASTYTQKCVDISDFSGQYHVAARAITDYGNDNTFTIKDIWLEK